jgi:hypothetical protein
MALHTIYENYYKELVVLYKDRCASLRYDSNLDFQRYLSDTTPLFVNRSSGLRYVTLKDIESDILAAVKEGKHFVEYKVHKYLYPGYKGDNISFLTGKYYILEGSAHIEIPGAPSLLIAIKNRIPEVTVTFIEAEHNLGVLRVEV